MARRADQRVAGKVRGLASPHRRGNDVIAARPLHTENDASPDSLWLSNCASFSSRVTSPGMWRKASVHALAERGQSLEWF